MEGMESLVLSPSSRSCIIEYNKYLVNVSKCAAPRCKVYVVAIDNGCGPAFVDECIKGCKCDPLELTCVEHRGKYNCCKK